MEDPAITQLRRRREFLHRRLGEARTKVKELETRVEEVDALWSWFLSKYDFEKVMLIFPPDPAVTKSTSQLILYAVSEFERVGLEGVERSAIVDFLMKWASGTKPNTIRVAFKRLIASHRIEKMGNLYRLPQTEAATAEAVAA